MEPYLKINKKRKVLNVKYDTNDGDYVTTSFDITEEELNGFRPLFEEIEKNKGSFSLKGRRSFCDEDESLNSLYVPVIGEEILEFFIDCLEFNGENPPLRIKSIWLSEVTDLESII